MEQHIPAISSLDIFVIGIIVISALAAYSRGALREILAMVGWLMAFMVTVIGLPYVRPTFQKIISWTDLANILSATSLFIMSLFFFSFVTAIFSGIARQNTDPVNRYGGLLIGLVRGWILVSIAWLFMVTLLPERMEKLQERTLTIGWIKLGAEAVKEITPPEVIHFISDIKDPTAQKQKKEGTGEPKSLKPIELKKQDSEIY